MIITSFLPFASIDWWGHIAGEDGLILDEAEHFEKMTLRNRYRIAGANGPILLTIPLASGREQRKAMKDICIDNKESWQQRHWRTIISAYGRAPFFEHYSALLQPLFTQEYERLVDFNLASIQWVMMQLPISCTLTVATEYIKHYDMGDLRKQGKKEWTDFPHYYQVFEERAGFVPNLSILDLLFSEGPHALQWLLGNRDKLVG